MESSSSTMVFAEGQRYKCEHCPARCCRFSWGIPVSREEYQRYHQTPWIQAHLQQKGTDFIPSGDAYQLPRVQLADGDYGCVFLDRDNLCMLQKREGHHFIPGTCQTYPFGFLEKKEPTSGQSTIYPVTSYFCPSILQNYGEPLSDNLQPLYERHRAKNLVVALPDTITLGTLSLGVEAYTTFSDWLLARFQQNDSTVPQVLLQARTLLTELITRYSNQDTVSADELKNTIQTLSNTTDQESASEVACNNLAGRTLVATRILMATKQFSELQQTSIEEGFSGKMQALQKMVQEKKLLAQLIEEKGTISFWDQPVAINLKQAKLVKVELSPAFQTELKRYFMHLVQSQQIFMQSQNLLKVLFLLACNYPSIIRMTRYVAYTYGRAKAQPEDLKAAIGYLDASYTNQARQTNMRMSVQEGILDFLSAMNGTFERVLLCESY